MFESPATLTVNGVNKLLTRINQDQYSSEYRLRSSDDEFRMNIRNSSYTDKKRQVTIDRHNVEVIHEVFPVAPATRSVIRKAYFVLENERGDNLLAPVHVARSVCEFLASNGGNALILLTNFES